MTSVSRSISSIIEALSLLAFRPFPSRTDRSICFSTSLNSIVAARMISRSSAPSPTPRVRIPISSLRTRARRSGSASHFASRCNLLTSSNSDKAAVRSTTTFTFVSSVTAVLAAARASSAAVRLRETFQIVATNPTSDSMRPTRPSQPLASNDRRTSPSCCT